MTDPARPTSGATPANNAKWAVPIGCAVIGLATFLVASKIILPRDAQAGLQLLIVSPVMVVPGAIVAGVAAKDRSGVIAGCATAFLGVSCGYLSIGGFGALVVMTVVTALPSALVAAIVAASARGLNAAFRDV